MAGTTEIKQQLQRTNDSAPAIFERSMASWFKMNGKRLANFAGSDEQAKQYMSAMLYSASRNPRLMECSQASLGDCLMQSAQLGLFPGAMQEVAYLPFRVKGQMQCTFVPMYPGLLRLAYNSGLVRDISTGVVYEKDTFDYTDGTEKHLVHKPYEGPEEERGARTHVWCVIHLRTGGSVIKVKNAAWLERRRALSPSGKYDSGPWLSSDDNYDEMAQKSILKYALKQIPKTKELALAIDFDNKVERPELAKHPVIELPDVEDLINNEGERDEKATTFDAADPELGDSGSEVRK